jgi:hypothetical protein
MWTGLWPRAQTLRNNRRPLIGREELWSTHLETLLLHLGEGKHVRLVD